MLISTQQTGVRAIAQGDFRSRDLSTQFLTQTLLAQAWISTTSTTGAGIDSFFEYVAKAYILLGDDEYYRIWSEAYGAVMKWLRSNDGFWVGSRAFQWIAASIVLSLQLDGELKSLAPLVSTGEYGYRSPH